MAIAVGCIIREGHRSKYLLIVNVVYSHVSPVGLDNLNTSKSNANITIIPHLSPPLPYQDTFDQPKPSNNIHNHTSSLASARYLHMLKQTSNSRSSSNNSSNDDISERNGNSPVTHRVVYKHHRNISHASMPDDIESKSKYKLHMLTVLYDAIC